MTQSPQEKIYFEPESIVILKQRERTFALSNDERNLFIINSYETREYVITKPYEPERGKLCELSKLSGEYSNGAWAVLVPVNSIDKPPPFCQVKIHGATKTYTFNKINRIGV